MMSLQDTGLSHSDIRGSKVACTSPRLVAACHVLHRLREPRHPPYALIYFRNILFFRQQTEGRIFKTFSSFVSLSIMSQTALSFRTYVENNGFEPLTPCLQSRCSSQLS